MKKNILILGGYSKNNIEWIENVKSICNLDNNVFIVKYDNWYNYKEMDFNKEIEKILSIINNEHIDIIIAKSIGIYLLTKLKDIIKLKNIIFIGYPLEVLKKENIDIKDAIKKMNKENKLYIIQQEKDPLCSYNKLKNMFNNEIKLIKIDGNDHAYDNYHELINLINKII